MATRVRIGCAGWSIPRQHAHLFGPGESMLARYATRFDAVEINSSFYRPHQARTYERWAASVPRGFRFSVKVPKAASHERGLRATGPVLDRFLDESAGLGGRLGGYLLQLPPGLALEPRTASTFFRAFRRRSEAPLACEPRHASWFTAQADALLERHGVSRAAADPARVPGADRPASTARWRYWRWHGSPRIYYSEYSDEALQALAAAVRAAGRQGAWIVFDNTAHGFAVADAARMQRLLE
ncbi:DUF72 domain-containing protein [Pseudoxanthomonas sp. 10H]|uniref:DUF72 domain-containing protein n=1 Tax=Pseudoxanthomonas sp. 10H TaxID=3242729 RepID=UPI0035591D99